MTHGGPGAGAEALAHVGVLRAPFLLATAARFVETSVWVMRQAPTRMDRAQLATMTASIGIMALGLL